MTPQEVIDAARQQYNSVSDDFFSDAELFRYVWAAQTDFSRHAFNIERTYTASTVIGQQEYSFPTNCIGIKRITYAGLKLVPISFREDDMLTVMNQATTATGTPQYYAIWNETIYLRPIPAAVATLKIFAFAEPQEVSATSTLEIPSYYHLDLIDYVLWRKAIKDKNFQAASEYKKLWDGKLLAARMDHRKAKRADGFTGVVDVESINETVIGVV